jgi:hypothetical protein
MSKSAFCIILLFFIIFESNIKSQDYLDTSNVVIKRVSKLLPFEYNISDTHIKKDKENPKNYILKVDLEVPVLTNLKLSVTDSAGEEVMKLIDDQAGSSGVYRIRWEMEDYPLGRYWYEFTTVYFIYRKDFFIK